ncbi:MAG TPA: response regulator [Pseudobdellovibrionaceae bacterium]|nr:response regulator [Pseudobdellovibrionaceae bacterium]
MKPILILDDEVEIANYVGEILKETGQFRVTIVTTPAEAYVRMINQNFDIVITDFRMPKSNGIEFIESFRSQKRNANTPVLIMSGFPSEVLPLVTSLTNVDVIGKPFTDTELIQSITQLIEKTKNKQAPAKPVLDVTLVNHFINATIHTIQIVSGTTNCTAEKPQLFTKDQKLHTVATGLIPMSSPKLNGFLAVSFPEKTLLSLLFKMTGEQYASMNSEVESATGEIINIIYGQARKAINQGGYDLQSSLPQVVAGSDHRIWNINVQASILVPFQSEIGPFYIIASIYN